MLIYLTVVTAITSPLTVWSCRTIWREADRAGASASFRGGGRDVTAGTFGPGRDGCRREGGRVARAAGRGGGRTAAPVHYPRNALDPGSPGRRARGRGRGRAG